MCDVTTAFWGMVINNYDETDLALVQQGYPDHIRQIVYTLERGEQGTPHIQAYIRLYRQHRMSYVRKLFPGASRFTPATSDEYKLNAQRYAQKLDKTAESPAVITNNPFPDPVKELLEVIRDSFETFHPTSDPTQWGGTDVREVERWSHMIENQRVRERPNLAKFYISPTYVKVWRNFRHSLVQHVVDLACKENSEKVTHTHTHTHSDEKSSREGGITTDAEDEDEGDEGTEDYEESEAGTDDSEGSESDCGQSDQFEV